MSYLLNNEIRILDVHGSGVQEQVVDVQHIISRIEPKAVIPGSGEIYLLYYASGMLAFLAEHRRKTEKSVSRRLVLLDVRPNSRARLRLNLILPSTENLFVRFDSENLFYGVRTENTNRDKAWSIQWCGIGTRKVVKGEPFFMTGIKGAKLGCNVCFDIFDSHLYAVSTAGDEDREMRHWRSFYSVACIPPGSQSPDLHKIWRRDHVEALIEESKSKISFCIDDTTGKPMVLESRLEWLAPASRWVRTYYMEPLPPVSQTSFIDDDKNLPLPDMGPTKEDLVRHQRTGKVVRADCSGELILAKNQYHTYHSPARAFIRLSTDIEMGGIRLRLRAGTCQRDTSVNDDHICPMHSWPANDDEELMELLVQSQQTSDIRAVTDDRSLVYIVDAGHFRPQIVLLSFDPCIQIPYQGSEDEAIMLSQSTQSGRSVRTMPAMHLSMRKGKWLRQ